MALHTHLPIYKLAYDLLTLASELAHNMPRDFKVSLGGRIRDETKPTVMLATAARYNVPIDDTPAKPNQPLASAARAANAGKAAAPGVKYRDAATGSTWTGRGLMPAWLKAALAQGKTLADFDLASPAAAGQALNAGSAGDEQMDEAGCAGGGAGQAQARDEVPA